MTLSILRNGTPLDQLYGAKGASTTAATGCLQNGVDVNQYLLALADGKALGFNSGLEKNGADFSTIFGIPTGNAPLPINGNSYTAVVHNSGTTNASQLQFNTNNSTWNVTDLYGGVQDTGSIPAGAVAVMYSYTVTSGTPTSISNGATAWTTLTGSSLSLIDGASNTGSGAAGKGSVINLTIQYRNSAGTVISTTIISFNVSVPPIP